MADSTNVENQVVEEVLGRFNDFPPGWEEIPMEDFVRLSSGPFLPVYLDYRQMWLDRTKGPMVSAVLQIQRDLTGFAIVPDRIDQSLSFFKFNGFPKLKKLFGELPIASDSGWNFNQQTSLSHRGISDYDRVIVFERQLTAKEDLIVRKFLLGDDCPGWTGISGGHKTDNTYIYHTTYDSSD